MEPREFQRLVERYKADLLRTAAQSTGLPGSKVPPTEHTQVVENPPEAAQEQGNLQTVSPQPDTHKAFLQENPEAGFLRIQAFFGTQAVPVSGAEVTVSRWFSDGVRRFAHGFTDESGILEGITLPAPPAVLAMAPTGKAPYATYDIVVSHPGYRTEVFRQVPVFADIQSVQPVRFQTQEAPL